MQALRVWFCFMLGTTLALYPIIREDTPDAAPVLCVRDSTDLCCKGVTQKHLNWPTLETVPVESYGTIPNVPRHDTNGVYTSMFTHCHDTRKPPPPGQVEILNVVVLVKCKSGLMIEIDSEPVKLIAPVGESLAAIAHSKKGRCVPMATVENRKKSEPKPSSRRPVARPKKEPDVPQQPKTPVRGRRSQKIVEDEELELDEEPKRSTSCFDLSAYPDATDSSFPEMGLALSPEILSVMATLKGPEDGPRIYVHRDEKDLPRPYAGFDQKYKPGPR